MNAEQRRLIELLRSRLTERAWLFEDHRAYRDGVEDTLDEVCVILDEVVEASGTELTPST